MSDQFAKTVAEVMSRIISSQQAAYSGWVAAGTGAGFALLVGNSDRLIDQAGLCAFRLAGGLLIASFLVHAVVRHLAMKVAVASEISAELTKLDPGDQFDAVSFAHGLVSRSRWPFSVLMRRGMSGDRDASRLMLRAAQAQTIGLAIQGALVVLAGASLLAGTSVQGWMGGPA